jgi:deoxycytidine triphosphate deaminase
VTMGDGPKFDSRILFEEKKRLSDLPYFQRSAEDNQHGVLLSDKIEYYCGDDFRLIHPFCIDYLRPAGYDLRVGLNYAIGGERHALNYGEKLTIGPYQVAVIQTLETLNVPDFLIGRWNIRVGLAYKGLLWVGGAQVDPGFRGRLSCPIYNLSTEPVELACGDKLAMIDFVTTTDFIPGKSIPFQWWKDKKLVFQQYSTGLRSGVEHHLLEIKAAVGTTENSINKKLANTSKSLHDSIASWQSRIDLRIDTFLTLIFTVVAVLFAGLGIVATKGSDEPSFVSSPVWVAAVALYFALKPYAVIWSEMRENRDSSDACGTDEAKSQQWIKSLRPKFVEILAAVIIVAGSVGFHVWHAHVSEKELADQKVTVEKLALAIEHQRETFSSELQIARAQADAKVQSLQNQIDVIRRK